MPLGVAHLMDTYAISGLPTTGHKYSSSVVLTERYLTSNQQLSPSCSRTCLSGLVSIWMSQYLFSWRFCLFLFLFFLIPVLRASGSFTPFPRSLSRSLLFPRLLACLTCLEWGIEHVLRPHLQAHPAHAPRPRRGRTGTPETPSGSGTPGHRTGGAPPRDASGAGARCRVLEHSDQRRKTRTRCSPAGRGWGRPAPAQRQAQYSQMISSAGTSFSFSTHVISRT